MERQFPAAVGARPPTFVVGCGRSGTTLLSNLLSRQSGILSINEPRDRWFVVDPRTDDIGLYRLGGQLELGDVDVTSKAKLSSRLISRPLVYPARGLVVEKSPSNVFRLAWLRAIFPDCKFINLVRDGREVVASIMNLIELNEYKIASGPARNQWWGRDNCKRDLVLRRALKTGLLSLDLKDLDESELNATAAMSEWIMSIEAMESFVAKYAGVGIIDVRYERIVEDPAREIGRLLEFMELGQKFHAVSSIVESRKSRSIQFEILSARVAPSVKKRFDEIMNRNGYLP